jgi:hypothetical protein
MFKTGGALLSLSLLFAAAGCSSSPGTTAAPAPVLLQFADTYDVVAPSRSGMLTLTLDPQGTYEATFAHGGRESGTYTSDDGPALPVRAQLTDGKTAWSFAITDGAGDMTITRGDATDTAKPEHTVGPSESLCDATGGTWKDDDSDPSGLYCACPEHTRYVPSRGGCVAE